MFSKRNILLLGGAAVLAYFLFRKKKVTKVTPDGKEQLVAFEPINVQPMPWMAIPNSLPEIKIN